MCKIGDITVDNRVVLAPMSGVSNSAFRLTVKEFGAGLVCAEMVSDKGIAKKGELIEEPAPIEKINVCMLHADRLIRLKGEKVAIMKMRKSENNLPY